MRLNMDRICQLAGVSTRSRRSGLISEGAGKGHDEELENESFLYEEDEEDSDGKNDAEDSKNKNEGLYEDEDEDANEMVDVDEVMLVQELRRARRLMNESRKRQAKKKQKLQEMQLKGIIDQEVKNVLKELQLNSGWIYGDKKPTRSRKGYTHQGSFLKGFGFK